MTTAEHIFIDHLHTVVWAGQASHEWLVQVIKAGGRLALENDAWRETWTFPDGSVLFVDEYNHLAISDKEQIQ